MIDDDGSSRQLVGQILREVRNKRRLSRAQIAEDGLSESLIAKIESGERGREEAQRRVAALVGADPERVAAAVQARLNAARDGGTEPAFGEEELRQIVPAVTEGVQPVPPEPPGGDDSGMRAVASELIGDLDMRALREVMAVVWDNAWTDDPSGTGRRLRRLHELRLDDEGLTELERMLENGQMASSGMLAIVSTMPLWTPRFLRGGWSLTPTAGASTEEDARDGGGAAVAVHVAPDAVVSEEGDRGRHPIVLRARDGRLLIDRTQVFGEAPAKGAVRAPELLQATEAALPETLPLHVFAETVVEVRGQVVTSFGDIQSLTDVSLDGLAGVAVVTAHNPHSAMQPAAVNAALQEKLRGELHAHAHVRGLLDAVGRAPDSSWSEDSLAPIGMSLIDAVAVATRFGQTAVYWFPAPDRDGERRERPRGRELVACFDPDHPLQLN